MAEEQNKEREKNRDKTQENKFRLVVMNDETLEERASLAFAT